MGKEKCKLNKENCWYFDEEDGTCAFRGICSGSFIDYGVGDLEVPISSEMVEVIGAKGASDEELLSSPSSCTNRDWLFSLSDKELAEFLCGEDFQRLKLMWNSSVRGVEQWLSAEHEEGKKAYERI